MSFPSARAEWLNTQYFAAHESESLSRPSRTDASMEASVTKLSRPRTSPATLCHGCLRWNRLDAHNLSQHPEKTITTTESYASVGQLQLNVSFAVCSALLAAYNVRSMLHSQVQSCSPSCLILRIRGPFYIRQELKTLR